MSVGCRGGVCFGGEFRTDADLLSFLQITDRRFEDVRVSEVEGHTTDDMVEQGRARAFKVGNHQADLAGDFGRLVGLLMHIRCLLEPKGFGFLQLRPFTGTCSSQVALKS